MKNTFTLNLKLAVPPNGRMERIGVHVQGTKVTLTDPVTLRRLAVGIWDAGGYVRYPRSALLPIHPLVLDELDLELRQKMTHPGEQLRATELRRSAVGYQDS